MCTVCYAAYTYDLGFNSACDGEDNLFTVLNNVLRERLPAKMLLLKPFLAYLLRGLAQLPVATGLVYRGVPAPTRPAIDEHYTLGADVHWSGFTITTLDPARARAFAQGPGGIIFRITLVNGGRRVSAYSAFPSESEVLLSPNARFIVTAPCRENPDGYCYVDMLERAGEGIVF